MLMLTAYADESGHSVDPKCRFVGLGGLVAASEEWDKFEVEWQGVLDEFIDGKPFHMRDFTYRHEKSLYVGWDESKRRDFLGRLVGAIISSGARPSGCVVYLDHFEKLHADHRSAFRDPYFMAFQEVTKGLSLSAMPKYRSFVPEAVEMVYAYQETFGATEHGRAQQLWHLIQKESPWGQWMGAYRTSRPSKCIPLQAADLFAYELTKEFENWVGRPKDKMRWALRQIINQEKGTLLIKLFTLPVMLQTLIESGALNVQEDYSRDLSFAAYDSMNDVRQVLKQRAME
jgi:hypothetical protein